MKLSLSIIISLFFSTILSAQSISSTESVEYDADANRFLISNGSTIIERASNGDLNYFGNAAASFGMEVMNGVLYAIQDGNIVGYDLETTEELVDIQLAGASFLNGLTNNGEGMLWATDFSNDRIYEVDVTDLENPSSSVVVADTGTTPNGVLFDEENNRLIFVSWGSSAPIKAVDLDDYSISTIVNTSLGNIDGIDEDGNGDYYISHWSPNGITKYSNDFSESSSITVSGISSPADICYAKAIDTLAIPNGGSEVMFVGFESTVATSIDDLIHTKSVFSVNPNRVENTAIIKFKISQNQKVEITLFDLKGNLVANLLEANFNAGAHKHIFVKDNLAAGEYIISFETIGQRETQKIIIAQ